MKIMKLSLKTLTLSFVFLCVSIGTQIARAQTVPAEGQKYPPGTQFGGPCKEMPAYPENPPPGTRFQGESVAAEFYSDAGKKGLKDADGDGLVDEVDQLIGAVRPIYARGGTEKCGSIFNGQPGAIVLTEPGQYWMVVYQTKVDNIHAEFNLMEKEEKTITETKRVKFFIEAEKICAGPQNKISLVMLEDDKGVRSEMSASERAEIGLSNEQLKEKQTVSVPKNFRGKQVLLEFGETKEPWRMRLERGSRVELGCAKKITMTDEGYWFWRKVELGKIWFNISHRLNPNPTFDLVTTERAVAGVRGTVFSVEYDPESEKTTLYVQEGIVEFASLANREQKILVKAKQTAVQQGTGAPRIVP